MRVGFDVAMAGFEKTGAVIPVAEDCRFIVVELRRGPSANSLCAENYTKERGKKGMNCNI